MSERGYRDAYKKVSYSLHVKADRVLCLFFLNLPLLKVPESDVTVDALVHLQYMFSLSEWKTQKF